MDMTNIDNIKMSQHWHYTTLTVKHFLHFTQLACSGDSEDGRADCQQSVLMVGGKLGKACQCPLVRPVPGQHTPTLGIALDIAAD